MQSFINSSVGRKMLVAVTGQFMILFIFVHVLGNSTVFFGGLNAYAAKLHSLPLLVWITRIIMSTVITVHVFFSIQLTLENWKSNPGSYAVSKYQRSTFASRNMIWTGALIGTFLLFHLLHFTFQVINPSFAASANMDALGRPDVTFMVISSFQHFISSIIYIAAMIALALHLFHGIQSSFQTLGINNERSMPFITKSGSVASVILFLGYIAIPVIILLGLLKGQ
ncbi:MAG: succinate dehydrogenase cytochrome b subunit [Nitrospiraceae bacterium]|nr:MAG: succinate dehydrogenase cytochrome b subunit [Nitrospiraceae bacterium]